MMMVMIVTASTLAIMVMMFVIVVMSASALIVMVVMMMFMVMVTSALAIMIMVMMLMFVVMVTSALVVVVVMMMLMLVVMIMMSTAYRAEIFVFFSSLLHRFQDLCTVQFFDRSGNDHCVFVHFTDQSDCFCYFLLSSLRCIGTAQNNRSCIL